MGNILPVSACVTDREVPPATVDPALADKRAIRWSKCTRFQLTTPEFVRQVRMRQQLLEGLFRLIDQNNDGVLNLAELEKVMPNAAEFLSVVDTNEDGVLQPQEFKVWSDRYLVRYLPDEDVDRMVKLCALASIGKQSKNGENVDADALFSSIDVDSDGFLSLAELEAVLGADAKVFLDSLDNIAKDGKVSQAEFRQWVRAGGKEYEAVNKQLEKINMDALRGAMALYSSTAQRLAKAIKRTEALGGTETAGTAI
eukprot:g2687.t1